MQILANVLDTKILEAKGDALFGAAKMVPDTIQISNNLNSCYYLPQPEPAKKYGIIYEDWRRIKNTFSTGKNK